MCVIFAVALGLSTSSSSPMVALVSGIAIFTSARYSRWLGGDPSEYVIFAVPE